MSLNLMPSASYVGLRTPVQMNGAGGVPPYSYTMIKSIGGEVNAATGKYVAPPVYGNETVRCFDATGAYADSQVSILTPIQLLCQILQKEMSLEDGRVYEWDQKIMEPRDSGLFLVLSELVNKPIGNKNEFDGTDGTEIQTVTMYSNVQVDVISRGPEAKQRKEEVLMAVKSIYAEQQYSLNSFMAFPLSRHFVNLSHLDGSAIPYRFNITLALTYLLTKVKPVPYFDQFDGPTLAVDP